MATNLEGASPSAVQMPSMLESSSGNIVVVSSVQGFLGNQVARHTPRPAAVVLL